MALKITFEAQTDVGLERSDNQDHFGSSRQENVEFFIVCDGMGGHAGGSTASRLGVQAIENTLEESDAPVPERMEAAIHVANDAIHSMAAERRELRGMGTTVAILGVDHTTAQAYVAHVGDSRIYRLRDHTFERLTRDHTMVQRLVDEGIITEEEAENHPQSNVISRSLGGHPSVEVEHGPNVLDLKDGDIFLLCSDGLCGLVSEPDMAETLANLPPDQATIRLIEQANDAGGHDNITAQVILIGEQAPPYDPAALQLIHPPKGPSAEERQARIEAAENERRQRKLQMEREAERLAAAFENDETIETERPHFSEEELERARAARRQKNPAPTENTRGAPVLEDQSSGKLLIALAGLIALLILLVIGLILKTSTQKEPDVVVPTQNTDIQHADDDDEEQPLYQRFGDDEPQPVYDAGYGYGEVYDVEDTEPNDGRSARERAASQPKADAKDDGTGTSDNPFAEGVGESGGKRPAFQVPSRENPFATDDDTPSKSTGKTGPAASPTSGKESPSNVIPKKSVPTPSKNNPFDAPDEPKPAHTERKAPAKPPAPPVKPGENPF